MSGGERRRARERRREAERGREMGGMEEGKEEEGVRGGKPVKSQVFMTSAQICVLTSAVIAASLVL